MESVNLIESFSLFKEDKNIDRATLMSIIEDVFRTMLIKKYGYNKIKNVKNQENLTDVKIVEFLQNIKGFLISLSNELDPTKDSDLLNLRDEMLATINKLAYLLTLE